VVAESKTTKSRFEQKLKLFLIYCVEANEKCLVMKYQGFDDEPLWLEQARAGNKESFGKLIEAYQGPVFNLAYRMLSNADEAEQAAQEAFIRAWTRLDSYNPQHKFSTWMLSITSNYCIDLIRKRRKQLLSLDGPLPQHPALTSERSKGPEAQAVQSEEQEVVQALLETLPEEYRQTVVLRYWYDMSYDEIAEVMETTVSAIKSRLFRARRQLADTGLEMGLVASQEIEAMV
jgi:RNA polymerase sigma-70 factor, ECF subfamily